MKLLVVAATALFGGGWMLCPPTAGAQTPAAMNSSVRSCIEGQAAAVEQVIPSLNEGTEFLVTKVCALPIALQLSEDQNKRQTEEKERLKALCEKYAGPPPKDTGFKDNAEQWNCQRLDAINLSSAATYEIGPLIWNPSAMPEAVSFAADRLLQLRMGHSPPRPR